MGVRLVCLGSGSSGNCYVLDSGRQALIIEAGLPFMEVKKVLGFNIRKIVGVVVSHCHGDHARFTGEYKRAGIPVFEPYLDESFRQVCAYGNFLIRSFDLVHDAPCCGFLIDEPSMGKFLYASDTEYIKYRFSGLNHILVEANYSSELIDPDAGNWNHVLMGHMELNTTLGFLRANNHAELKNVILCHLSEHNADPELFRQMAAENTNGNVYVADQGLDIILRE